MSKITRYPIIVNIAVQITDGESTGHVSYGMPVGKLPTDADMPAILKAVGKALPPEFRLMNRAESTMQYLREERGYRGPNLIIPKLDADEIWHDPATDVDWTDLGNQPEADEDDA